VTSSYTYLTCHFALIALYAEIRMRALAEYCGVGYGVGMGNNYKYDELLWRG
jgi:hypothetical protein